MGANITVSDTTLRLLLPLTKRTQSIFVNIPTLTIPPLVRLPKEAVITYFIPTDWLAQLLSLMVLSISKRLMSKERIVNV